MDHFPFVGAVDPLLDEIASFLTGTRHAGAQDRRLPTVLFTDIVESTAQLAGLGDRRWRELLERHHALIRNELRRRGGREIKTTGDGFLATFDGPARAIECPR